eukprot:160298_1
MFKQLQRVALRFKKIKSLKFRTSRSIYQGNPSLIVRPRYIEWNKFNHLKYVALMSISAFTISKFMTQNDVVCEVCEDKRDDNYQILCKDDWKEYDTNTNDFWERSNDRARSKIKILVVDGGGLRGCMCIQILKAIEQEMRRYSKN